MISGLTFLILVLLIAINALYVMAEFASVSARPSRLAGQVAKGNKLAARMLETIEDTGKLDAYIATCQVGITISSLALGFYGQAQLAGEVAPMLAEAGIVSELAAQSVSATVVLVVLSLFQALLGEIVPKNISIQYPERLALLTARPMQWSITVFKPLIWVLNGSGQFIMRTLGLQPDSVHAHVHAPEEIALLADESRSGGILRQDEYNLLRNTLSLARTQIREVMTPSEKMLTAASSSACASLVPSLSNRILF